MAASGVPDEQVRVFLWALPRSVSTAMTKCMSFVDGAQVWFEPYLYSFHNQTYLDPAFRESLPEIKRKELENRGENLKPLLANVPRGKRLDNNLFDYPWVKEQLETAEPDKKLIFVKDMAHVLNRRFEYLPSQARKFRHTFLIRDPRRMYPSFRKMMMVMLPEDEKADLDMTKDETGDVIHIYKYAYELWKYTKENLDPDAIIIDGTELIAHPEKLLPKYFDALGIPYKDDYLKWDGSPDIMIQWKASFEFLNGAYLANIIKSAVDSTHFIPEVKEVPSKDSMTSDVIKCVDAALPYYNEMFENRIKP